MASKILPEQIVLDVNLPDEQTFLNFEAGENELVVEHLKQAIKTQSGGTQPFLTYLSGPTGAGKSHLLVATCHLAKSLNLEHFYINLDEDLSYPSLILDGLERLQVVCIDNIQWIQQSAQWQRAMFDLINRVKESNYCKLFLSSNAGPKALNLALADLSSRLTWGISFHLNTLDESAAVSALLKKAKYKGIAVPAESLKFLVQHCRRDMHTLTKTLDKIEHQSLQEKRKISIPLIKQVLSTIPPQ
ncbi:DnaA regulatory inactivator Hda [Aliiglaciecola sp. M165]|uniref:DnaA regulatory inactivator Hda n=1 Tax=Aliiglaciecola sp. M165 TaxID=2593649 RepID=UPI00117CFABA|nr:DnaA regulatory inactivator Hda [Aliiglaciecola sp. M165]TRY30187.1 DnaA regulatory inactivator Hda [Aliiglaciecola sp. M165]